MEDTILDVKIKDLVKVKVMTEDEANEYVSLTIKNGEPEKWYFLHKIQTLVTKAVEDKIVKKVKKEVVVPKKSGTMLKVSYDATEIMG